MKKIIKDTQAVFRVARRNPKIVRTFKRVVFALVIIALLWLGVNRVLFAESRAIEKDNYQAVFLTNGQVYFGKISRIDFQHIDLNSIYYLQTQNDGGQRSNSAEDLESGSNEVRLIKLGNELHGPKDRMLLSRQQVLFWENLDESGRVSEAIREYSENSDQ